MDRLEEIVRALAFEQAAQICERLGDESTVEMFKVAMRIAAATIRANVSVTKRRLD